MALKNRILDGEVGIFPTDTIYGLTGNALDEKVVEKILRIKRRKMPFSLIPHSIDWIRLIIDESQIALFDEYIGKYTGRFSTLWKYSERGASLPYHLRSSGLVSIRLPNHWITEFAADVKVPLVTTSVNIHRQPYMTSLDDLPGPIRKKVDFIVYEGPLRGSPSTIVHCYDGLPFKVERR